MEEHDIDTLNHLIWRRFHNVASFMRKLRERELSRYGVTVQQAGVLHHAKSLGEDATLTAIARAQYREPAAVSVSLNRLEKQGYVYRQKKTGVGNQTQIIITQKGLDVLSQTARRETIERSLSSLSVSQKQQLMVLLTEIRGTVIKEMADYHRDTFLDNYQRD